MNASHDGEALVYCEGAFGTTNGKTAHGLVRFTRRYRVAGVVDSRHAGQDAGVVLEGKDRGIPIYAGIEQAIAGCAERGRPLTHLVMGLAPDGGGLSPAVRQDLITAVRSGLNVDSGLHVFLTEDEEIARLAAERGVTLRDVRLPPHRSKLHFFTGKIERVRALRVAVLGTDSAVGKRTTAWELVDGLEARGVKAALLGTGQTAWMQGVTHGVIFDSLVNDFVTGEIEHAVYRCDEELRPDVIVVEGQGSLMNPAYPGGHEILAAARPTLVVLQHAPARKDYDGFDGYPIHPIEQQIQAVELLSGGRAKVIALTVNSEGLTPDAIPAACAALERATGLPAVEVLRDGPDRVLDTIIGHLDTHERQGTWPRRRAQELTAS